MNRAIDPSVEILYVDLWTKGCHSLSLASKEEREQHSSLNSLKPVGQGATYMNLSCSDHYQRRV